MILKGALKRIVIPSAAVTEVADINYKAEAIGYETTIKTTPDTAGQTHYEYIVKKGDQTANG